MQFTENPRPSAENKLLAFPAPGRRGPENPLDPAAALGMDLDQMPHDIARLCRPASVESMGPPRLSEQDGLAHDARNLVTSIELFSALLAEPGVLGEAHQHFAGDLKLLTGPLTALVEQMASASSGPVVESGSRSSAEPVFVREPSRPRLGTGRAARAASVSPVQQEGGDPCDAGVLVKSCERLLGAIAGPTIDLHISYERGLGDVSLSGEALTRVLINLVRNASEAMPSGGRVVITARKGIGVRPSVLVSVQDTGRGIPAHALGQIFQAGFSSKKTQRRWPAPSHYGLGLTIVRDLVEAAGGSVRVASTLTKGTTFELKLPCRRG